MRNSLAERLVAYEVTAVPAFWKERDRKVAAENDTLRREIKVLNTELHTLPAWFSELERLARTGS